MEMIRNNRIKDRQYNDQKKNRTKRQTMIHKELLANENPIKKAVKSSAPEG